jgi:hypothetical protein
VRTEHDFLVLRRSPSAELPHAPHLRKRLNAQLGNVTRLPGLGTATVMTGVGAVVAGLPRLRDGAIRRVIVSSMILEGVAGAPIRAIAESW